MLLPSYLTENHKFYASKADSDKQQRHKKRSATTSKIIEKIKTVSAVESDINGKAQNPSEHVGINNLPKIKQISLCPCSAEACSPKTERYLNEGRRIMVEVENFRKWREGAEKPGIFHFRSAGIRLTRKTAVVLAASTLVSGAGSDGSVSRQQRSISKSNDDNNAFKTFIKSNYINKNGSILTQPDIASNDEYIRLSSALKVTVPDAAMQADAKDSATEYSGSDEKVFKRKNNGIKKYLKKIKIINKKNNLITKEEMLSAILTCLDNDKDNAFKIAKVIQRASGYYGGFKGEKLTYAQSIVIIRFWFFENILGSDLEVFIAKKIAERAKSETFDIKAMRELISFENLQRIGLLQINSLSFPEQILLKKAWKTAVAGVFPFLFRYEDDAELERMPLSSYDFVSFYAGSVFLQDIRINSHELSKDEINAVGEALCHRYFQDKLPISFYRYLSAPAAFNYAQGSPQRFLSQGNVNALMFRLKAIKELLSGWQIFISFRTALDEYNQEMNKWMDREKLAEKFITEHCPDDMEGIDEYLNGFGKPPYCNGVPDDITEEYQKRTEKVAGKYAPMDRIMVSVALASFDENELKFISEKNAKIHEINAHLFDWRATNQAQKALDKVSLIHTDLFSVTYRGEERIYAFKRNGKGYDVFRVDREIFKYIALKFFGDFKKYNVLHSINKVGTIKGKGENFDTLIEFFINKHKQQFTDVLFASGYKPTTLKKIWDVGKHFIPFYDCIDYSVKGMPIDAGVSCTMDVIAFIPVVGQAAKLSAKFGEGLLRGIWLASARLTAGTITKHSLRIATSTMLREIRIPNANEWIALTRTFVMAADPGFWMLTSIGQISLDLIVIYLRKWNIDHKWTKVIMKLKSVTVRNPASSEVIPDMVAKLPGTELKLPYRIIGKTNGQYKVALMNPETGEKYGKTFQLDVENPEMNINDRTNKNGELCLRNKRSPGDPCISYFDVVDDRNVASSSIQFTFIDQQMIDLISQLKILSDEKIKHIKSDNLNSDYYGEGQIYIFDSTEASGSQVINCDFIEVYGQRIPVKTTLINNHGYRYDAFNYYNDKGKTYPIAWRKDNWVFEEATDICVSSELKSIITPSMYEKGMIDSKISVPDSQGVRWDKDNLAWIKVDNHYIRITEAVSYPESNKKFYLKKEDGSKVFIKFQGDKFYPESLDTSIIRPSGGHISAEVSQHAKHVRVGRIKGLIKQLHFERGVSERQKIVDTIFRIRNSNADNLWKYINLDGANLNGLKINPDYDMVGVSLERAQFINADLKNANLREVSLSRSKFMNADLSGADISNALLSKADFRNANMKRANLDMAFMSKANLDGVDLIEASLQETYLFGASLKQADISHADLHRADLRDADLSNTNLEGAILRKADLRVANLKGANLRRANVSAANMKSTRLVSADLSAADLNETCLQEADLRRVNLQQADLNKAQLMNANLRHARLQHAVLTDARLTDADLYKANLSFANLDGADLNNANLSQANLNGAKLNYSSLAGANLKGADLSHAELQHVILLGTKLNGAILNNSIITIILPVIWNDLDFDILLNHIHNPHSGSLLTMIDSIDDSYTELKVNLANQLVDSLKPILNEITDAKEALIDIFSREPYRSDKNIAAFIQDICRSYFREFRDTVMLNPHRRVLDAALNFFNHEPLLMVSAEFNAAFIQTIDHSITMPEVREIAINLYQRYLEQEALRQLMDNSDIRGDFGDYNGNPDWSTINSQNYILFSPVDNRRVMMLSSSALTAMCSVRMNTRWNHFFIYQEGRQLAAREYNLAETLTNDFPLFSAPWSYASQSARFKDFLHLLKLDGSYYHSFSSATISVYSSQKLVSPQQQEKLKVALSHTLFFDDNSTPFLQQTHYDEILNTWQIAQVSSPLQAKTLLSLSIVFSQYSSSSVFGTETESPLFLRYYASALMQKAHQLDPAIFGVPDHFADWDSRLLGRRNAFSCTSVLTSDMIRHAKAKFPETLKSIFPPAWY